MHPRTFLPSDERTKLHFVHPESRGLALLAALPGAIALALGALYGMGAIQVYGQLLAANLSPIDLLPLIPLEQMLGRGIAVLIGPIGGAVLFVVIVVIGTWPKRYGSGRGLQPDGNDERRVGDERSKSPATLGALFSTLSRSRKLSYAVFMLAFILFAPLATVVGLAIALAAGAFVGLAAYPRIKERLPNWPIVGAYTMAIVVGIFAATVAEAFLDARPLRPAKLDRADGSLVTGDLVVVTGDTWWVQIGDRVAALPASDIVESEVSDVPEDEDRSVFDVIVSRD